MSVNKGSASRGLSSNSQSGGSQLLPDVQVFTADGTWNKPSGSYQFEVVLSLD